MPMVFDETQSEEFRTLPPARLDETRAPEVAILTRFRGALLLRGKIERVHDHWDWHFVLDTTAPHAGTFGQASTYDLARMQLLRALADFHVRIEFWRDSQPPPGAF
jgi:hypothetical protein